MDIRSLPIRRQRGFVLVTALVFLVILTLVVLSVANMAGSEEKIQRNFRDSDLALSAAEAALRDAELRITGLYQFPGAPPLTYYNFSQTCDNGLCDSSSAIAGGTPLDQLDFFNTNGAGGIQAKSVKIGYAGVGISTGSPSIKGVLESAGNYMTVPNFALDQQPRYMIEMVNDSSQSCGGGGGCPVVYRITAQAVGRFPNTRVVLQEIYQPSVF